MVSSAYSERGYQPYRTALKVRVATRDDFLTHVAHREFARLIERNHTVIEYGCTDGHHLHNQKAKRKVGVEPNPMLRRSAQQACFPIYASMAEVAPETADLILSTYDLNYAGHPLDLLQQFNDKLVPGGRAVFILCDESHGLTDETEVPDEDRAHWTVAYAPRLLQAAGFEVVTQYPLTCRRIRFHRAIAGLFGWSAVCHLAKLFFHVAPCEQPMVLVARKTA